MGFLKHLILKVQSMSQILERTLRLANIKRKQEEAHVQTM